MSKKVLLIITVLIVFLRITVFKILIPISLYYVWFGLLAFIFTSSSSNKKYNLLMLLFLIIGFFSVLLNDIDQVYMPWQRLISFSILMIAIGPLLEDSLSISFKIKLFKITNITLIVFTIVSFGGYLVKFPLFFNDSGFTGLTSHSMLLGPIAALSSLTAFNLFFNGINQKQRIIYLLIIFVSILTCVVAASRGAVVALLVAIVSYTFISFRKSLGTMVKVIFVFSFIVIITSSIWFPFTEILIQKQLHRTQTENLLSGRDRMWMDRIEDFKYSPIYGVGFASMKNTKNSQINQSGYIEPGTSWLLILSSLGILGLIILVSLIIYPIYNISKKNDLVKKPYSLISSILIFFVFHMGIEGYVLSSGGLLFFYLWLTIALAQKRAIAHLQNVY